MNITIIQQIRLSANVLHRRSSCVSFEKSNWVSIIKLCSRICMWTDRRLCCFCVVLGWFISIAISLPDFIWLCPQIIHCYRDWNIVWWCDVPFNSYCTWSKRSESKLHHDWSIECFRSSIFIITITTMDTIIINTDRCLYLITSGKCCWLSLVRNPSDLIDVKISYWFFL